MAIGDALDRELGLARAVLEHSSDAVFLIDRERRVLAANPAALNLLGQGTGAPEGELFCTRLNCQYHPGSSSANAKSCPCLSALNAGQSDPYFELTVSSPEQPHLTVTGSASLVPWGDQTLVAVVMRDMSEKRRLEEELDLRRRQAELLYDLSRHLSSLADLEASIRAALLRTRRSLKVMATGWWDLDPRDGSLTCRCWAGEPKNVEGTRVSDEAGPWVRALALGESAVTMDLKDAPIFARVGPTLAAAGARSAALVPLKSRGQVLGALHVVYAEPRTFRDGVLRDLESIAAPVAAAVDNLHLLQQVRDQSALLERQRLAAEIHDSLAQTISIISQRARDLPRALVERPAAEAQEQARALVRAVDQAYQEVRQAIFDLKIPVGLGFADSLGEYLEEFGLQHGLQIHLDPPPDDLNLPLQAEVQLVRIIQEALNNVRKHAEATRVSVSFSRRSTNLLSVTVADNGVGFDRNKLPRSGKGHYGLQIMQERAKAAGGVISIRSAPGAGTTMELDLPV